MGSLCPVTTLVSGAGHAHSHRPIPPCTGSERTSSFQLEDSMSRAEAAVSGIVMEEMMVPSADPGIEIYVRNKRSADLMTFTPERTVLFMHGAAYPASTSFDLQVDGLSWMDYIA